MLHHSYQNILLKYLIVLESIECWRAHFLPSMAELAQIKELLVKVLAEQQETKAELKALRAALLPPMQDNYTSSSDDDDDDDDTTAASVLDDETQAKLKAAALEKLAAAEGKKTVEELKAHTKTADEAERTRLREALNRAASLSFARQQIKLAAALSLGFDPKTLKEHMATLDENAKATLEKALQEAATTIAKGETAGAEDAGDAAAPRSGKSLWRKARVAIPLVRLAFSSPYRECLCRALHRHSQGHYCWQP